MTFPTLDTILRGGFKLGEVPVLFGRTNHGKCLPHLLYKVQPMREAVVAMIQHPDRRRWLGVTRKHDRNDWGLPGGQVEPGEDGLTAIIREVREETGREVTQAVHVWSAILDGWVVHTFVCLVKHAARGFEPILDPAEGDVGWKTEEELSVGTFGANNKERFSQLRNLTDA